MRRRFAQVSFLALTLLLGAPVAAALERAPAPEISAVTPNGYRLRVPIGEARIDRAEAAGLLFDEISIPGGRDASAPGEAQLPVRVVHARIPWGVEPRARLIPGASRSLGSLRPAPFARIVSEPSARGRRSAAEILDALRSPRYAAARPEPLRRAVPMAARGARILAIEIAPIQWDPASGAATQYEEVVIEISWDRPATPLPGEPGADAAPTPASASAARAARAAALEPESAAGPRYAIAAPSVPGEHAGPGPFRVRPSRPWVRLGTVRSNLYRVTPADLAAAGVATGSIDPASLRLFRARPGDLPESVDVDLGPDSLRECAVEVIGEGDGSFDSGDALYFFGTGANGFGDDLMLGGTSEYVESQRASEANYWLTWGPGSFAAPPLRASTRDAAPATPAAPLLTEVTHRIHFEQNRIADFDLAVTGARWERWFDRIAAEGARVAYPLTLPTPVQGGAGAVRFRLWGQNSSIGITLPDHVARLTWNRALIDTVGWNFALPADLEGSGFAVGVGARDTLEVAIPVLNEAGDPNRTDVQYLAWFEVTYPRRLQTSSDTLFFAAPDSVAAGRYQYAIGGVGDVATALLYDRTDPERPVRLTGGVWSGAAAPFTLTFEDSAGGGARPRYAFLSTARAAAPASVRLYAPLSGPRTIPDLLDPANEADYVVIAPPAFHAAAESLAADRSAYLDGIPAPSAKVVTSDRVFAQFGGGTPDPTAIRNFLAYAARHWARIPLYVCLLGDASGDPLNHSGLQVADVLPAYSNGYDIPHGWQYVADDWLVRLGGPTDELLDMAVGRLPARTAAEALDQVRGKRRLFERNGDFDLGRNRVLLSADDAWKWSLPQQQDIVGLDHTRQMERKDRFHIPFPVTRAKVYVNDYAFSDSGKTSKPGAREAFVAAASRGNWLVDYVGHGSGSFLADEQVFRFVDATRLTNVSLPSIWAFMSCTVGRFDDYRQDGLAETLVRQPSAGAAAAIAASQEVFGIESTDLNDAFLDELFPAAPRVDTLVTAGLALARAKNRVVNLSTRKYNFIGEPGLRPPLPRGRGVWEKGPLDSLLRGETATLRGHAIRDDGTPDTTANGTAKLRILGPPSRRVLNGFQGGNPGVAIYNLPGPVLYEGETALDRGSFEITFTVPVDGRVSGAGARLEALLEEAGGKGVGLAADSLRIGAGLDPRVDVQPPTISLLAPPDTVFAAGNRVTIALEDSSGIDLTRFDNAHAIFALFDDAGLPIDLTADFRYERGSATRGTVELTLPALAEGAHRLEVHASDTYRNIGVANFIIEIAPQAGPEGALDLSQVFNYPNPFANDTYLHVRLNQPARLKITILTVAGRRVRSWAVEGKAGENYIPWDGRDSRGESTAVGVYLIHVTADAPGGGRVDAVAKALRTR
jgi:hypothetical protein